MNKFIISEEEKSRILEMHETATNKQYLSEQVVPQSLTDIDKKTLQNFLNKINTNTNPPTHWILDRNAGPLGRQRGDEVKLTGKENGMIYPTDFVGKPLTWSLVINGYFSNSGLASGSSISPSRDIKPSRLIFCKISPFKY